METESIIIQIKKNGAVIKTITSTTSKLEETFNEARDIAGGMWNGVDKFSVTVIEDDYPSS